MLTCTLRYAAIQRQFGGARGETLVWKREGYCVGNLFIIDNSDTNWKAKYYLYEWAGLSATSVPSAQGPYRSESDGKSEMSEIDWAAD